MSSQRITLRIDRVVVDQPGLTPDALDNALRAAIETHLAERGTAAFIGGARATATAQMPRAADALPVRVASAALKAVTS
ncbi:hypothetical protein [uncultured Tateyamaria sp.]|uniref:hypothetical protein n=1 Tax=uncultured Tateyamaria sp. TaxID=455651 RepID=UPI00260696AB|nr:hypothetical protein [uncultured Tateyamaria sp.]